MSFHFRNGIFYLSPYSDTGPGTITVDQFADIFVNGIESALTLSSGSWTIVVNGAVSAPSFGIPAINLVTPGPAFLSTITVGEHGEIFSGGAAIKSEHPVRIRNAGSIAGGIDSVQPNPGIVTGDGIDVIINWGTIRTGQAIDLGGGNDVFTNFKKVGNVVKQGVLDGSVDLGAGNDIFSGGNNSEAVEDS